MCFYCTRRLNSLLGRDCHLVSNLSHGKAVHAFPQFLNLDFNSYAASVISYRNGDSRNLWNDCSNPPVSSVSDYRRQQITFSLESVLLRDPFTWFAWHWVEERQCIFNFPSSFHRLCKSDQYVDVIRILCINLQVSTPYNVSKMLFRSIEIILENKICVLIK